MLHVEHDGSKNIAMNRFSGLSLRSGGWRFSPATTSLSPGYLYFDTNHNPGK